MSENKSQRSSSSGLTLEVGGQSIDFTTREVKIGRTFYYVLAVFIIYTAFAAVWAILDIIQPSGKFADFIGSDLGIKITVIGIMGVVLFLLLVFLYGMHRKGTKLITKALFAADKMNRELKVSKLARFTTRGLLVSVLIFTIGFIWFLIEFAASGSSSAGVSPLWTFLHGVTQSVGVLLLTIGVFAVGVIFIIICFAWLWNAGNIYFTRHLLKIR